MTTDRSRYVVWEAANQHNGLSLNTGVHFEPTAGSGHIFTVNDNYLRFFWLELRQYLSAAVSDECIRIGTGILGVEIGWCWFDFINNTDQCDGIYAGNYAVGSSIDPIWVHDNRFTNCPRACIHAQNFSGSSTQFWRIYNNQGAGGGAGGGFGNYGVGLQYASGTTINIVAKNNNFALVANATWGTTGGTNTGTLTTTGSSNNLDDDGLFPGTTTVTWTSNTDPGAGSFWIITSLDANPIDQDWRPVAVSANAGLNGGVGPDVDPLVQAIDIFNRPRRGQTCQPGCYELPFEVPAHGVFFGVNV